MYVVTKQGRTQPINTNASWKLLVWWKFKYESSICLNYIKESHDIEVAEFARERGIADEPAFAWWVP